MLDNAVGCSRLHSNEHHDCDIEITLQFFSSFSLGSTTYIHNVGLHLTYSSFRISSQASTKKQRCTPHGSPRRIQYSVSLQQVVLKTGSNSFATIRPVAVIQPAKSHTEIIITAIAARDEAKASAYARRYDIPTVHTSYQALIDDPSIDAVYIPLPNGLHFEWALKSLQAGKHVLLEKPSTSNAIEAECLFRSNLISQEHGKGESTNPPVLLEAFHTLFHPAFKKFLSLIEPTNVAEAHATLDLIKGYIPKDDIRMNYDLSGGSLMDCGAYTVLAIRQIFQEEPVECVEVCSCSLIL